MSLDFPTLCFPITMNWGMGKLKLSTCPLAVSVGQVVGHKSIHVCVLYYLETGGKIMAIMNQEAHQHVNCQISACRLALPSSLALTSHIKFNKCFFLQEYHNSQFSSASWIYDNFGKKTVGSWNWFYLGFAWFTWFTIDSKISTSPWLCCIFALRWNGRWKSLLIWKTSLSIVVKKWNEPTQKIRTHRDEFSWNPGKIIDPNIPSAFLHVMHHRNHSFPWELTFENEANVEDSMLQVIDLPLAVGCLVNIYIFNPLLSEATFPPTPK